MKEMKPLEKEWEGLKDLTELEKEFYNRLLNKIFVTPDKIGILNQITWQEAAIVAASLCEEKMETAFLVGRSRQSWDSFLKESNLPISVKKCHCEPHERHGETSFMCCNHCGLPIDPNSKRENSFEEKIKAAIGLARSGYTMQANPYNNPAYTPEEILQKLNEESKQ